MLAARVASDELTDVALAELAKAIAEAVHAETAQQEVAEATTYLRARDISFIYIYKYIKIYTRR